MYVNFAFAALFPSPYSRVKKCGKFKTNIHLVSIDSFLYYLSSRMSRFLFPSLSVWGHSYLKADFLIGGVPFLILSKSSMICLSLSSSGLRLSSSTSTKSLSKYWASSGFKKGKF